jgi:hypothetical protein
VQDGSNGDVVSGRDDDSVFSVAIVLYWKGAWSWSLGWVKLALCRERVCSATQD